MSKISLKRQISMAMSIREVYELLKLGETYIKASRRTKINWTNAARKRAAELGGELWKS